MTISVTASRQDAGECADALRELIDNPGSDEDGDSVYDCLSFRQRLLVGDLLDALRSAERGEVREKTAPVATHDIGGES